MEYAREKTTAVLMPGRRLFFIRYVLQNVFNAAVEYVAEVVQCGGGNVPALFERVERPAAERIVLDKRVRRDAFALHCFPKRVVSNNGNHLCRYYISHKGA